MTIEEARNIYDKFNRKNDNYTEEEFFLYTEAAGLLIRETKDSDCMLNLGGYYYSQKNYDLAFKYYEMSADYGNEFALVCLGYIWYYGRTGEVDYKKAYEYFSRAGYNSVAKYKIADMYHNGYYVEKDEAKYKEIIEELYRVYKDTNYVDEPLPELCVRLAGIRKEEGNITEAVKLLKQGKSMLGSRIGYSPFWGNLNIMESLITELYSLIPFDRDDFDFYDLFELLKKPVKVQFTYNDTKYMIESVAEEDGTVSVCFNGKWYRTFKDLISKEKMDDSLITLCTWKYKDFEVL